MLLRVTNAGFIGIIPVVYNERQIVCGVSSNPYGDFIGKDQVFGLFHFSMVCFHQIISDKRTIQFCLFVLTILQSVVGSVSVLRLKMRAQDYWLHIDNAKPRNAALSFQKTEKVGFTRLSQSLYSHDIAPYDFFLFGYLKKELKEKNFRSENEMISAVRTVLNAIQIRVLSEMFEE
jgi:hypothetical protein